MGEFIEFGGVRVLLSAIVAIERGHWESGMQDWNAILVCHGNVRLEVPCYCTDAAQKITAAIRNEPN